MSDVDTVSAEEWSLIRALRRVRQPIAPSSDASQDDLESAYRRLEDEVLENVGATLDRMIKQADRTSANLDVLLRRLSETAGLERPVA
jgi:hypothetical protein